MNCYITNPFANSVLPEGIDKSNTLFYPEAGMTTHQLHTTSRPRNYHIVTDSHFLVGLYKQEEVFVWNEKTKKWNNPKHETYGASYNLNLMRIWDINSTIPAATLDGKLVTNCLGR